MRKTRRVLPASVRRIIILATLIMLPISGSRPIASAQFGRLGDKILKPISTLLGGKAPITTSVKDAKFGDPLLDSKNLPAPQPITMLERTANGGFILKPGLYEMHAQSYCLHAGTYGPGGGDGYSYAPVEGPAKDAVISIVRNSYKHPEIKQRQIQQLLWAVIARAKFEDLTPEMRVVASKLLTPKQLATLNRSALDIISGSALQRELGLVPPGVRQVLEAEARLRQMLTAPNATFAEMERVAVLAGDAPIGEGSKKVPAGRWSRHPDGYLIRYMPRGYSYTVTQVWVPGENAANAGLWMGTRPGGLYSTSFLPQTAGSAAGKVFDPSEHIAVPGNTARQRLLQSPKLQCDPSLYQDYLRKQQASRELFQHSHDLRRQADQALVDHLRGEIRRLSGEVAVDIGIEEGMDRGTAIGKRYLNGRRSELATKVAGLAPAASVGMTIGGWIPLVDGAYRGYDVAGRINNWNDEAKNAAAEAARLWQSALADFKADLIQAPACLEESRKAAAEDQRLEEAKALIEEWDNNQVLYRDPITKEAFVYESAIKRALQHLGYSPKQSLLAPGMQRMAFVQTADSDDQVIVNARQLAAAIREMDIAIASFSRLSSLLIRAVQAQKVIDEKLAVITQSSVRQIRSRPISSQMAPRAAKKLDARK